MILESSLEILKYFKLVSLAAIAGFSIIITLIAVGQRWVRSYHHTLTYMILPVAALVITSVISGNIALSLGMIGALSIVRFRNPVKNSFELVMFLVLLTIGIAIGVNLKWALTLNVSTIAIIFIAHFLKVWLRSRGLELFSLSFEEGSVKSGSIEITSTKDLTSTLQKYGKIVLVNFDISGDFFKFVISNEAAILERKITEISQIPGVKNLSYEG